MKNPKILKKIWYFTRKCLHLIFNKTFSKVLSYLPEKMLSRHRICKDAHIAKIGRLERCRRMCLSPRRPQYLGEVDLYEGICNSNHLASSDFERPKIGHKTPEELGIHIEYGVGAKNNLDISQRPVIE